MSGQKPAIVWTPPSMKCHSCKWAESHQPFRTGPRTVPRLRGGTSAGRTISLPSALLRSWCVLHTNKSAFCNKAVRLAKVCCASATSVILQRFSYAAIIAASHHSFRPAICKSAFIFSAPALHFSAREQELECDHMGQGDNLFNKKCLTIQTPQILQDISIIEVILNSISFFFFTLLCQACTLILYLPPRPPFIADYPTDTGVWHADSWIN